MTEPGPEIRLDSGEMARATAGLFGAGVCLVAMVPCSAWAPPGSALSATDILAKVAETVRADTPADYSENRRYSFRNARFRKAGEMNVKAVHRRDATVDLQVLPGPPLDDVSRRVITDVMKGEQELSGLKSEDRALSAANYAVKLLAPEALGDRRCHVLEITPRRKSKFLLKGRAWIDTADSHLVRIQGHPTASVSIWVGKPLITQDFGEADGAWVQTRSHTVSSTLFLGASELTIDHSEHTLLSDTAKVTASLPPGAK